MIHQSQECASSHSGALLRSTIVGSQPKKVLPSFSITHHKQSVLHEESLHHLTSIRKRCLITTFWGIVSFLLIALNGIAFSQTPEAVFLNPTDSSANIPLSPTIQIRTNFPIDTTQLFGRKDTITDPDPTILLLESAFYDELPDSLIGGLCFTGNFTVEDDTTISYTVPYLEYETSYNAIINNLWVINGSGDTVQVPLSAIAFTTVLPPHRLVSTTVAYQNNIQCTDTLTFQFNRPLDSTSAGTIINVYEFDPLDTNLVETQVASTSWFDSSKESIYTTVGNMSPDKGYRVRVELHNLGHRQFEWVWGKNGKLGGWNIRMNCTG